MTILYSVLKPKIIVFNLILSWIGPLLSKGYKTPLLGQDLYNLVENEEAKYLTDQLEKEWQKELLKLEQNKKPSLLMAICRIWCLKFALNSLLAFFEVKCFSLCFSLFATSSLSIAILSKGNTKDPFPSAYRGAIGLFQWIN